MLSAIMALFAAGLEPTGCLDQDEQVVNEGECVAIFHSIHRVMKAEKILQGADLEILLIPVPRQLSADCGMAIRFSFATLDAVTRVLRQSGLEIAEIWRKKGEEFDRLS